MKTLCRMFAALGALSALTACDEPCPDWWGEHPTGPRTGEPCDAEAFDRCSTEPQVDPWVYECVEARLRVTRNGLDATHRCVRVETGEVTGFSNFRDLKAGYCYTPEEDLDGPSTGEPCAVEGATQCAADVAADPYFYLCHEGALEVFDHEHFRGAARCVAGADGMPRVRYEGY